MKTQSIALPQTVADNEEKNVNEALNSLME